jgi:hypothetical protein
VDDLDTEGLVVYIVSRDVGRARFRHKRTLTLLEEPDQSRRSAFGDRKSDVRVELFMEIGRWELLPSRITQSGVRLVQEVSSWEHSASCSSQPAQS